MFGKGDTGKCWTSQVCPRAILGVAIILCHDKVKHRGLVCLSPQSHIYICVCELPHFHHGPTPSLLHSLSIQALPKGNTSGSGLIHLSRHSVDGSPRVFHSSINNVARASCFEALSAFVESRKLFVYGSMYLTRR